MASKQLSLATLHELKGGDLAAQFDTVLAMLNADCNKRPGVTTARKISLHLKLVPESGAMGLEAVEVEPQVTYTMPRYGCGTSKMQPRRIRGGQLMLAFDPDEQPATEFGEE